MIALLVSALLGSAAVPGQLLVVTPRGESRLPIFADTLAGPQLAASGLAVALRGQLKSDSGWYQVTIAQKLFRFWPGVAAVRCNDTLLPLASAPLLHGDTLFIPLQFAAEMLPSRFTERYRWDQTAVRLTEIGPAIPPPPPPRVATSERLPNGLKPGHVVTIDPGHGGVDPGTHGQFFAPGMTESKAVLQIGLLLREELKSRGIGVVMTRTTDTLISLYQRGSYCRDACDLFVSIHVNSLPPRRADPNHNGFTTYILAEARTEEASRVEKMENEAIRFENNDMRDSVASGLDFILRDLQANEYLRESARLADLIQDKLEPVHTGADLGVKQANFVVLTTAQRPAVLVETGFRTSPSDIRMLTTKNGQKSLAAAIADAIVAYLLEYERRSDASSDSATKGRP
ncbi:MAG: N-acetylmuramoyl-L-alanine amidase [Gemmatimonadota bacterium]